MLTILFVAFVLLILIGLDVGYAMLAAAWLGIEVKPDRFVDTVMMPLSMIAYVDSYALVQIPLFILAGELMNQGGLTQRLIAWSSSLVGGLRGSLGHVAIITNFVLSGVSGSAVADAVATGKPLIPAMREAGYGDGFPGAVIVAGALLGPIIPPSIPMVVYGQLANVSIVKLFMAGIMPGIALALGFLVVCTIVARRRNYPRAGAASGAERLRATSRAGWALLMPVIIIGGVRFGWVTDTEAAAVAAIYALLVSLLIYRAIGLGSLPALLVSSAKSTAVILFLLAAAGPFSWLIAESQVNEVVAGLVGSIAEHPTLTLLVINGLLLVIGCIVEPLPAMIIFVPTLLPFADQLGIDPIQFGAVVVLNLMIGLMHPPIGLLLFVAASVGRLPLGPVVRDTLPFLAWALVVLVVAIVWPPLTTWLPGQVG